MGALKKGGCIMYIYICQVEMSKYMYMYETTYKSICIYTMYVYIYSCGCTSCAQRYQLPQSHCGDNKKGTLFSWLYIRYAHHAFVTLEHSVCHGSLMTAYIYVYIYISIYIYIYIYNIYNIYIHKFQSHLIMCYIKK